ncbi:MAG: glycosyltransferase family 4 protein [Bacteroidia bacterium]|nr:glycosyltransferase family 4 protein [Bacteroidia bacterium]
MPRTGSKKVLILCAHRPGRSPSQRYRFEQYLGFLETQGFDFTFSYLLNEKDDALFYARGKLLSKLFILLKCSWIRLKDVARYKSFDFIFIQREAHFLGTSFFEKKAFHSGAKVIFDFDDSIWLADTSPGNQKWEWIKSPKKFYTNIKHAHVVFAGNTYLLQEALKVNPKAILVPTTIDTQLHIPKHELRHKETVCIGWSGSLSTLKHFELLMPVLKRVKEKYRDKVRFKLMGEKNYTHTELSIESVAWTENREVDELNSFDIGLMPLKDDAWARGKCGLKGLSYMACEVPVVMSAVGVNTQIIRHGENGYLAKNEEEWLQALSLLIEDKSLRLKLGKAARETVEQHYSVERFKKTYLQAFQHADTSRQ